MKKRQVELELVSTKKLIRELISRYDSAAFVGMRVGEREGSIGVSRSWAGNSHTVAGLCHDLATTAIDQFKSQALPE